MFNLIKLERKKFRFHFISLGTVITDIVILLFLVMTACIGKVEKDPMCNSVEEWMVSIVIFTLITYIVYGSTILSKVIISEYRTKTIQLMFMYPINRKKLLLSKTMIVFIFTVINITISNIFLTVCMGIIDRFADITPGTFTLGSIMPALPLMLISIVAGGFLSIVPLYFGMRKKSTVHTIVAAIIVAVITCSEVNGMSVAGYLLRILITGAIAAVSVILTIVYTLNNTDSIEMD